MLPRQSLVIGSISAPEDFAGDDDTLSAPAQPLDRIPHHSLRIATSIGLCIIKEVHPFIMGVRHTLDCDHLDDLLTVPDPGPHRECAEHTPANPKLTLL